MTRMIAIIHYLRALQLRERRPSASADALVERRAAALHPDTVAALRRELDAEAP